MIRRTLLSLCLMVTATMAWAADVSTAAELKSAFSTGSDVNVYVTNDIVLTETVELTGTRSITLDLKGHTITANGCRAFHVKSGNLVITSSEGAGKVITIGSINIESSVIRVADAGVNVNSASLSINEGVTIESEVCYGVTVFGKNSGVKSESLIVNGAIHTKVRPAISGNGNADLTSTSITIYEKAEITTTNDVAIYHPQNGTLTVNGTVEGAGGIEMKAGEIVVGDDAVITATGALSHTANSDGSSTRGYAIAIVENGKYAGVSTVNVSPKATLHGPVAVVKDSEKKDGAPEIIFDNDGLQMLVKVTGSDSKEFGQYRSLELAMSEAPAGSTITLLGDCNIASTIETTKDYTLDLDGHVVTSDGQRALWIKSGKVTIKSTAEGGKIEVPTVANNDKSVIRVGSNESAAATLTVAEGVTISADECYGITVFGTNFETLTVNGNVNTKIRPAISGNGSAGLASTTITIGQKAQISTTNEVAIYHPQAGTLTVDGTVTGATGIEIKGGKLVVGEHAKITATDKNPSHVANNDGTSTRGYSIAIVENNGGYGNGAGVTAVKIDNDANLTGPVAQLQDSPIGDFNPNITDEDDTNLITVAAIGNDEYFTVKDAISIVPSEGSVRLLDNLTLTTPLVMDVVKTYTLNLNGQTLTGSGCAALQITNGHVTLDGGAGSKVTVSGAAPQAAILMGSDDGSSRSVSLTINKDVTVDGGTLTSGIMLAGDVTRETLTVNGTVQATNHSAIIGSKDANKGGTTIHIAEGANVTATDAVAIYHPQSGELLVDGNVTGAGTTAGAIEMKGGDLTITSTATITAVGTMSHTAKTDAPSTNGYAVALVENPAFTGVGKVNIDKSAIKNDGVVACLIDSKNDNVAEPMFVGDVTMVAETNISESRGDKYDTLPHAIAAAAESGEVKLLDDLTLANTFTISNAITLSMDDYSLINANASDPAVNIAANVTLKNGGIMSEKTGEPATDKANGGIKVTSGTVTLQQMNVKTGGVSLDVVGGTVTADKTSTFSSTKDNTVTLSGGKLDLSSKVYNFSASTNKNAIAATSAAALDVKSAVVISSDNGNAIDWNSTGALTVAGGKVSGAEAVHASNGPVTINGGTFTGTGNAVNIAAGTPNITGGTFVCGVADTYKPINATSATRFISGVNTFFSKHIAQNLCHEGYMVSQTPKNNGMYYLIDEIVIYDGADWNQPSESFKINKAKYVRNSGMGAHGTQFGTLCLPFSFSATQTGMTFYTVNRIDGNILYLDAVTADIAAGTPVVFKCTEATTDFTIESTDADISAVGANSANNLVGTFTKQSITSGLESIYYLNSDAFHQAKSSLTVPAFRAYISFSSPVKEQILLIHTNDDMTDGVERVLLDDEMEAVYDLQGRKQNDLQRGVNIMKMKDGRTIKVFVK